MRRRLAIIGVVFVGTAALLGLTGDGVRKAEAAHVVKPINTVPPWWPKIVSGWHTPDPGRAAPVDDAKRPMLVLRSMALQESVSIRAKGDTGGFSEADLATASHVLRDPASQAEFPVDDRTLSIIYQIQRNFEAQEIRIVSGYRKPKPGNTQGNHGKGKAIDFIVPGTSDSEVAHYARQHGFVGVGIYPIVGFIHVDIRDRSYFWCDRSLPGASSRERGILLDIAQAADDAARARGESPPSGNASPAARSDEEEDR